MKKSTIVKIVLLALVAVFAFTLVACGGGNTGDNGSGEKITIYLDPNGGDLGDQADEIQVVVGENIGKLPTPTRGGYKFLGWYEDGNERWEIDRKTKAEYDMDAVALWEPLGELVTVEFLVNDSGASLNSDTPYVEVVKGQKISTVLKILPTASRADYNFKGWKDISTGAIVTATTQVNSDIVISPIWEKIVYCLDGTENHGWNAWQEATEATCTSPAQSSRSCGVCGHIEYNVTQEALGHRYGDFSMTTSESGSLVRTQECTECGDKNTEPLNNITYTDFNTPVVDGEIMTGGQYGPTNLVDGDWKYGTFCGKGTGAVTVTLKSKDTNGVYVDVFCVAGAGSATYTVSVTYANGETKDLGLGAFGGNRSESAVKSFEIGAEIVQIVINMPSPSNGMDFWAEIAALTVKN